MKKLIIQLRICSILTFMMLMYTVSSYADTARTDNDAIMHAAGVLKGIYEDYSKEKAISILQDAAENDTTAYAMNVLGLLYMEGIGTERNIEKAVYWLNKAGECGFHNAYHNLGVIYKLGKHGEKQDFTAAYNAFTKGAE